MSKKMTKKDAQAVCDHEEKSINKTYQNVFTNNGTQPSGVIAVTTNCTLK